MEIATVIAPYTATSKEQLSLAQVSWDRRIVAVAKSQYDVILRVLILLEKLRYRYLRISCVQLKPEENVKLKLQFSVLYLDLHIFSRVNLCWKR